MQRTPLVAAVLASAVVGAVVVGCASTAEASDEPDNRGWETSGSTNRGWDHDQRASLVPARN
jgi:hypothetical protein